MGPLMFQLSSWLQALRRRRRPQRRRSGVPLRVDRLEERLALDSGGAFGQLGSDGRLQYGGGPLLTNVAVQPLFLQDSGSNTETAPALQAQLNQYFNTTVTDSFIPTLLTPYSEPNQTIGLGTVGASDINVPVTPDLSKNDISSPLIQQIIQTEITAGRTAAPNSNNLYVVFTPPGDSVDQGGFFGFHSVFPDTDGVHNDYYAVILDPNPPNNLFVLNYNTIQELTSTSSHELAEAITDPNTQTGWLDPNPNAASIGGEICDLVINDTYTQNGFAYQYQFENSIPGSGHSIGTVNDNLFINQIAPPAVGNFAAGGPVATFTDPDPTKNATDFTATVDFDDGFGPQPAFVTGGANGVYVISAAPVRPLTNGQHGTVFNLFDLGMAVQVQDTTSTPVGGGGALAVRDVPYKITGSGPLNYVADQGGQAHAYNLSVNGPNFVLTDFGQEVYQQPVAGTTGINITAEPGVDSSLTLDFSGGVFTNPITFDGGSGPGVHNLSITGGNFSSITENATGASAGSLSLVSGTNTATINFTDTTQTTFASAGTSNLTLNLPAGAVSGLLKDDGRGGNDVSELASLGGFPSAIFTDPAGSLNINLGKGNALTVGSPDTKYHAPLTITDAGAGQTTVSLNGPITLGAQNQFGTLNVTAETINVNGSITTINNGVVTLTNSGPLTFAPTANITAAGAVIQNGTGAVVLAGSISTPTTISFTGAVKLGGSPTLTARTVTFAGTVDDTIAATDNLAITGNAVFRRSVGGSKAIASLSVSGATTLGGGTIRTGGNQTYTGAATLSGSTILNSTAAGNITFGFTIDGSFSLTVNTAGTTTFTGGVGGNSPLVSLATDAGGSTILGGGGITTTGIQSFGDSVVLGAPTTLSSANNGDIVFGGSLNGAFDLTVNTGGTTAFNGPVGAAAALASLITDSPGTTALGAVIITSGDQDYADPVALNAPTVLSTTGKGNVTLAGAVDGAADLSINSAGTITLAGALGSVTALTSLTIGQTGTTILTGGAVTTTGAQAYNNPLKLTVATTVASTGNGNITFGSTVNGGFSLAVNTAGVTTFSAPVGGTTALASVITDSGGSTVLGASIKTGSGQTYGDAVTLTGQANLTSTFNGSITFGTSVDGAFDLAVSTGGVTAFSGPVGATTPLASLTVGSSGHTALGGAIKTTGAQSFGNFVVLSANSALTSTSGGAITLGGTVDGAFALTVSSSGTTTFSGPVGNSVQLASLATAGTGTTLLSAIVKTSGAQSYGGPVSLGGTTSLSSSGGGNLSFGNTVDGAFPLALSTSGAISFGAAVGAGTPLTSVTTSPAGSVLLGALVQTTGAQTYANPITLTGPANLTGGSLSLGNVDGAFPLTLNSTGQASLNGALGSSTPLASLTTGGTGSVLLNSGTISTSGTQTYQDTLAFGPALANLNASNAVIGGTLNLGTSTLNVNGNLTFTPTGTLSTQLAGTQPSQIGHVITSGTIDLGGANLNVSTGGSFTPPPGSSFDILFPGSGTIANTFANLPEGGVIGASDVTLGITYVAGNTGNVAELQVLVGVPVQLAFLQQPASAVAGQPVTPTVTVIAEDANGKRVPIDTSTITLAATGPGTLGGTVTAHDGAGGAVFSNLLLQQIGTYTLTATAPGMQPATSASFNVTPAAPTSIAFAVNPADGAAGQALTPVQVALTDAFGNGSGNGLQVGLSVTGPGGFAAGSTTATVSNGLAAFPGLILTKAGSYTVTATAPGLGSVTSTSFNVGAGAPSQVSLENSPGSIVAGKTLADFKVDVQDRFGNVVSGVPANAVANGPGTFSAGAATVNVDNGVATFSGLALKAAGSYTVAVSVAGLSPVTSARFNVTPGPASQLGFEATPATVVAGQVLPNLAVDVQDSFGNLIAGAANPVTLAVTGPGTPSAGTTSTQANSGVATFAGLILKTAGNYTLTANAAGLKAGSTTLTVNPGPGALTFQTPPTAVTAGATLPDLQVNLQDSVGNPLSGVPVTLTVTGPGTLSGGTSTTQVAGGVAKFTGLVLQKAGTYTLSAAAPGQTATPAATLTVNPGAPGQLVLESSPTDTVAGQGLGTLKVDILDAFGNPVSGNVPVTLTANGPGALSGTTAAQTSGGTATFTGLALPKAGSYTLSASATGLTAATSASFNVAPGAASSLAFELSPSTTPAGAVLPDLKVDVLDAFGNLTTTAAPLALTVSGPGVPVAGNATATVTGGVAIFHGLVLQKAGSYSLSAGAAGLGSAPPVSFTVNPAAASQLVFEPLPAGGTAGQLLGPIKVDVLDPYGNLVNTNTQVTLITGGAAQLTTAAFASGGVATFSSLTLPNAGTYNLVASASGVAPATASALTIAAAPQSTTAGTGGTGGTGTTSRASSATAPAVLRALTSSILGQVNQNLPTVRLQVLDSHNRPVKGGTLVTLKLRSGKLLGKKDLLTDKNGMVNFTGLKVAHAGHYTLLATAPKLHKTVTIHLNVQ